LIPLSRISAVFASRRRLPKVGALEALAAEFCEPRALTSTTVAFLLSGIGRRDAVFTPLMLPVGVGRRVLPGLGLEKLAGEGLCKRESDGEGDVAPGRVKSVNVMNFLEEPAVCGIMLPLEILALMELVRLGSVVGSIVLMGVEKSSLVRTMLEARTFGASDGVGELSLALA